VRRHLVAAVTIAVAVCLDTLAGAWYAIVMHIPFTSGLCYAVGIATTSGSSVPSGASGKARLVTVLMQITIIPLFGATWSLFTSALGAVHVREAEVRIKDHFEARLKHHLGKEG
jgi:hypothetical protein